MTTLLKPVYYYFWVAPHILQAALAVLMVRRGLHRQFPVFFAYTVFEAVEFAGLFMIGQRVGFVGLYFPAYSLGTITDSALRFGLIYEIFRHLFRNYRALRHLAGVGARWSSIVLLLGAVALAAASQTTATDRVLAGLFLLSRSVSTLQCGLLLCLLLFSSYFRLSWRNPVFGIALGLGVFASVDLTASAFRTQFMLLGRQFVDFLAMGTYHVCVLLWMFYLLAPERSPQYTLESIPEHNLDTWNQELQRLLRRP
jgi:hypothetical protein